MSGPFRSNVYQSTANKPASFDPPLDGLYVVVAPDATVSPVINGFTVPIAAARLSAGTHLDIGGISAIDAVASFTYVGLRRKVNGTITDNLDTSG